MTDSGLPAPLSEETILYVHVSNLPLSELPAAHEMFSPDGEGSTTGLADIPFNIILAGCLGGAVVILLLLLSIPCFVVRRRKANKQLDKKADSIKVGERSFH